MADDYDSPWKEAIENYFADFLQFYFPRVYAQIDWNDAPVFLDQELRAVVQDAELGNRFVDKLVRIRRKDGCPGWLYIHLEVQGEAQKAFSERIFVYHYRLYDRYRQPIVSLALLADDLAEWRPDHFGYEMCDCRLDLRFPVAKLLDWVGSEARLDDSRNPFAVVTRAHLSTRATRDDPSVRFAEKWHLVRSLYRRDWDRQRVIDLFKVIDWMMRLPSAMAVQFRANLAALEEEIKMPYVSSVERLAIEEGFQKGVQQGLQKGLQQGMRQGMQQGMQQGQARVLTRLLVRRFGNLPAWVGDRIAAASEVELDAWADAVLAADSVDQVFGAGRH